MPVFANLIARIMKTPSLPSSAIRKEDSLNAVLGQFDKKVSENYAIFFLIKKDF